MRRHTALSVLTVAILLIGAWSLQPTSQARADATFGKAEFSPPQGSLLVKALWELPEFQKNYRASLQELEAKVWQVLARFCQPLIY